MGKDKAPAAPYDIDEQTGIVKGRELASRVVVFGSFGWALVEAELNSTFLTGGLAIIQRMGYSYGKYIGMVVKKQAGKTDPVYLAVDTLIKVSRESGWGKMVLTGGSLQSGVLRIILANCLFCSHTAKGREAKCHFLAGVVGGLADEVAGGTHRAREERCIAKEDNVCEIVLERVVSELPAGTQ